MGEPTKLDLTLKAVMARFEERMAEKAIEEAKAEEQRVEERRQAYLKRTGRRDLRP